MRGRDERVRDGERGAVLILGALFAAVAVVAAALAVDVGRLVSEKRSNQRVADLAALDAVRAIRITDPLDPAALRPLVETRAQQSAARNGFIVPAAVPSCPVGATGVTFPGADGQSPAGEMRKYTPGSVVPGNVAISTVGYDGLANARVSLDQLATQLGISAGTVDDVMHASFTYQQLMNASATVLNRNGDAVAAAATGIPPQQIAPGAVNQPLTF